MVSAYVFRCLADRGTDWVPVCQSTNLVFYPGAYHHGGFVRGLYGQAVKVQSDGTIVQAGDFTPLNVPMDESLQEYVYWMADAYEVDFTFLMALIRNESNFQADVISTTNDYGLMQINQKNHEWLSNAVGVTDFLDPYQNIQAGIYILGTLFEKYDDPHKVLMAYNMGESGASKLWDQGIYQSKYSQRVIGYQETYIKELNGNDQM